MMAAVKRKEKKRKKEITKLNMQKGRYWDNYHYFASIPKPSLDGNCPSLTKSAIEAPQLGPGLTETYNTCSACNRRALSCMAANAVHLEYL